MPASFEVHKSSDGQFRFVLKTEGGETILTSELYRAKSAAERGIASVRANCGVDGRYEKKVSSNGKPYFNLTAANHEIIGTSQMYSSEQARDAGVESVKANGATSTVRENP